MRGRSARPGRMRCVALCFELLCACAFKPARLGRSGVVSLRTRACPGQGGVLGHQVCRQEVSTSPLPLVLSFGRARRGVLEDLCHPLLFAFLNGMLRGAVCCACSAGGYHVRVGSSHMACACAVQSAKHGRMHAPQWRMHRGGAGAWRHALRLLGCAGSCGGRQESEGACHLYQLIVYWLATGAIIAVLVASVFVYQFFCRLAV